MDMPKKMRAAPCDGDKRTISSMEERRRAFRLTPDPWPTEFVEQTALFKWAWYRSASEPALLSLFSIPNGSRRDAKTGVNLVRTGLKAGVPDICLAVPRGGYHALYIELKRRTGGKVSERQQEWIDRLRASGYRVEVCMGASEAIKVIEEYLCS